MKSLINNFRSNIFILAIAIFIFSCSEDVAKILAVDTTNSDPFVGVISSTMTNFSKDAFIPISVTFTEEVNTFEQESSLTSSEISLLNFDQSDVIVSNANLYNFTKNTNTNYTFNLNPYATSVEDYNIITVNIPAGVCQSANGETNVASTQFNITSVLEPDTVTVTVTVTIQDTILIPLPEEVSIHGIITDAVSNERVEGVTVYWVHDDEVLSVQSDELGYYIIENLLAGSQYELTLEKNAFATMNSLIDLTSLNIDETNRTYNMTLYPLTSSVHGTVYKQIETDNIELAANVSVIADFTDPSSIESFSPNHYITTTNSYGEYTFSNLPSTASVNLKTLPFYSNPYNFSVQTKTVSLSPNMVVEVDDIILPLDVLLPFVVQNTFDYGNIIDVNDNIVITFSTTMDDATFSIELKNSSTSEVVPTEISWDYNTTLTIDPLVSLQKSEAYSLSISGVSQNNGNFSQVYSFNTQDGIQYVSTNLYNVEGNFDDFDVNSNIEIEFSMPPNYEHLDSYVWLFDSYQNYVDMVLSTSGSTLIINPVYHLEYDDNYTIEYKLYSAYPGDYAERTILSGTALFFNTESNVTTAPTQMASLTKINVPSDGYDFDDVNFSFRFYNIPDVDGYRIYAYDTYNNSDFIEVLTIPSNDYLEYQDVTVNLAYSYVDGSTTIYPYSQFDYYDDDGLQTPLAGGTRVYFGIVAYNDFSEGLMSPYVYVEDTNDPDITNITPGGSLTSNGTYTLYYEFNEYMDTDNSSFSYSIEESGGDENYILSTSSSDFYVWDPDHMGITFTFDIVSSSYIIGGGDIFTISGFQDISFNNYYGVEFPSRVPNYETNNYSSSVSYPIGKYELYDFESYPYNTPSTPFTYNSSTSNTIDNWGIQNTNLSCSNAGYRSLESPNNSNTTETVTITYIIPEETKVDIRYELGFYTSANPSYQSTTSGAFSVNDDYLGIDYDYSFSGCSFNDYTFTTASGTGDMSHTFSWSYTTDSYSGKFYIDRIEIIWDDE